MELKNSKNLKVFYRFGFIYSDVVDDENVVGTCPFCGKEKHFYIKVSKKLWNCKKCGRGAGYQGFLQEVNKQCVIPEKCSLGINARLTALSKNRGIQKETFRHFEIGIHPMTAKYILPVWDQDHTQLYDLATYDIDEHLMNAPGSNAMLYGIWHLLDDGEIWLTGGQWDCLAMHEILEGKDNPLGVPGETTFKRDWIRFFENRIVNVVYDNDESGTLGMIKVEHLLKDIPGRRRFIHWAKSFPEKFDVRDSYIKLKFNKKITLGVLKSMLRDYPPKGEKKIFNIPGTDEKFTENGKKIDFDTDFKSREKEFYNNYDPSQSWIAKYFICVYGEIVRFNQTSDKWHVYNDKYWAIDHYKIAIVYLQEFISGIRLRYSADMTIDEERKKKIKIFLTQQLSFQNISNILRLSQSNELVSSDNAIFNNEDYLLNLQNGTYDLRKMVFRTHSYDDYISHCVNVRYKENAKCPYWEKFISEIMLNRNSLIKFIQQLVGICLTGDIGEQYLFFLHGKGMNGKSVFINALRKLLGPYYQQSNTDMLIKNYAGGSSIPNDIAKLTDCRLTVTTETDDGSYFDPVKIKSLTGGDAIEARFLHKEFFTFEPKFKLFVVGNKKPKIKGNDYAVWRRICMIPFLYHVPKDKQIKDRVLLDRFVKELSGILNWAIAGWKSYIDDGGKLYLPDRVCNEVQTYKEESNPLSMYLQECIITAKTDRELRWCVPLKPLYDDYKKWCKDSQMKSFGKQNFVIKLEESGFLKIPGNNNKIYIVGGCLVGKKPDYISEKLFQRFANMRTI